AKPALCQAFSHRGRPKDDSREYPNFSGWRASGECRVSRWNGDLASRKAARLFLVDPCPSRSKSMFRLRTARGRKMLSFIASPLAFAVLALAAGCNGPGLPPPPCYGPDNGQGTVNLPPSCGLGPIGPINA